MTEMIIGPILVHGRKCINSSTVEYLLDPEVNRDKQVKDY